MSPTPMRGSTPSREIVTVRVTVAEKQHWRAAAEALTGGDLGSLIRHAVELEIGPPPEPAKGAPARKRR